VEYGGLVLAVSETQSFVFVCVRVLLVWAFVGGARLCVRARVLLVWAFVGGARPADNEEEEEELHQRLDAKVYIERLKEQKGLVQIDPAVKERALARKKKKKIIPGADYLESIPHAPWPSRSMLKRRVVLGTPADAIVVKNGVTRIHYPSGACYEGEVRNGKRHGNGMVGAPRKRLTPARSPACWPVVPSFNCRPLDSLHGWTARPSRAPGTWGASMWPCGIRYRIMYDVHSCGGPLLIFHLNLPDFRTGWA
jgi:hypothetical protein